MRKGEFHENAVRKGFTVSEMVAIKRALEPEIGEEAKERMINGKPCVKFTQGSVRDKVGGFVGVSGVTLEKAEFVVGSAEKDPEKYK